MRTYCVPLLLLAGITSASAITVKSPASGATVNSPFNVVASTETCHAKPAVSMGLSIDHAKATIELTNFSAKVVASEGAHVLHVKCWGKDVNDEVLLNINVVPTPPTQQAATPAFSPAAGNYTATQSVALSDVTAGAAIYYTTNGSAPTTSSAQYTAPISVSASQTIEAIAVATGYTTSGMARADYVITTPPTGPTVPSNAIVASSIQARNNWHFNHDAGTPGNAEGETSLVSTPSLSGNAREVNSSYTDAGGEIYSVSYAKDTVSSHFLYDVYVWIEAGSKIANLEMDSNQVTSNGQTVIYAFQCDGYAKVWDYSGPGAKWVKSKQPCDVNTWSTNAWHHIQISYQRDTSGNVKYNSVWLDGNEQAIDETVPSSFSLGWAAGVVQTQFQVDGPGASGSSTLYFDNLTISRW